MAAGINSVREGLKDGAVWTGLDEGGCVVLMSERIWKCVIGYG